MVLRLPNNDAARLARIHNTKWLQIGIDKAALEEQLRAKQLDAEQACERERRAANLEAAQAAVAERVHRQEAAARTAMLDGLQAYRVHEQGREKARDWDLSRPDQLRLDRPARVGDDDPCCGPASIQKFRGEDLAAGARQRQQMEDSRREWQAQAEAKALSAAAAAAADKLFQTRVRELDALQTELKAQEAAAKSANARILLQLNQDIAKQAKAAEEAEIQAEKEADKLEVSAALASDFLSESASTLASDQVHRTSEYKGMTAGEREAITRAQQQQMVDHAAAAARQAEEERAAERAQAILAQSLRHDLLKAEVERLRIAKQNGRQLQEQVSEKAKRDAELQSLYKNVVRPSYFGQFETSHR